MARKTGTISRGIRCPIIRQGDDMAKIVVDSVIEASEAEGFALRDRDVVAITESVVARAQGNYATVEQIAKDVKNKLGGETIGVIFPILSRNRFAICLRGIAMGAKKIVLMLILVAFFCVSYHDGVLQIYNYFRKLLWFQFFFLSLPRLFAHCGTAPH
jgi:hypothetical protein